MQDPDPKCRHFVILWHFGIFPKGWLHNQIRLFLPFRLFHWIRLLDFPALIWIKMGWHMQWHFICYKCPQLYFRLWSSSTRIGSTGMRKLMGLETIEDPTLKMLCHGGFLSFWFLKCTDYLLLDRFIRVLQYNFTCPFQYDIERGIFWQVSHVYYHRQVI